METMISWCTKVSLQYFHLPSFLSKKSYGDRGVADVCRLDQLEICRYISRRGRGRSLIQTSLLFPSTKGIDPSWGSCVWAVLFSRVLLISQRNAGGKCVKLWLAIYIYIYIYIYVEISKLWLIWPYNKNKWKEG